MKQGEQFKLFDEHDKPIVTLSPKQIEKDIEEEQNLIATKYVDYNVSAKKFEKRGNDWYYENVLVDNEWEKSKIINKYGFAGAYLQKPWTKKNGEWYIGNDLARVVGEELKDLDKDMHWSQL